MQIEESFIFLTVVLGSMWSAHAMPMPTPASDMMNMAQIENYFVKYNYMGDSMPDKEIADMYRNNKSMAFYKAAEIFQKRHQAFGLQVTGELDVPTMELMMKPRCGVPDINSMSDMMDMKRKRRYALAGSKWNKLDLTYQISAYTPDMSRRDVDKEIRRAFQLWEDHTPLRFSVFNPQIHNVLDIDIKFVQPIRDHGDGFPFDGPGGTLAHAFFPQSSQIGGDSHFDEAETWTLNTRTGINLFQVAAHEFGHALGLRHSMDSTALMAPFYQGYIPNFTLPDDDKRGIQALYGPPNRQTTTTTAAPTPAVTPTMDPEMPDMCGRASFDAITTVKHSDGYKTYGFQGAYYFLLNEDGGIAPSYPRLIRNGWPGLPDNIDAALFWDEKYDQERRRTLPAATFIFKGNYYWRVEDMTVKSGPRPISQWELPSDIDAAFVWKPNGKTYFFKGNQYYRYTEGSGVDPNYPKHIAAWRGLPYSGIDAAMQSTDGKTYFFKRSQYYLFNDHQIRTERGYPQNNSDRWFKCRRNNGSNRHHGRRNRFPSRRN